MSLLAFKPQQLLEVSMVARLNLLTDSPEVKSGKILQFRPQAFDGNGIAQRGSCPISLVVEDLRVDVAKACMR